MQYYKAIILQLEINFFLRFNIKKKKGKKKRGNQRVIVGSAAAAAKSLQPCPTLCNPIEGSPPGSPSLGFSRQEQWSGLPLPSPMDESEK